MGFRVSVLGFVGFDSSVGSAVLVVRVLGCAYLGFRFLRVLRFTWQAHQEVPNVLELDVRRQRPVLGRPDLREADLGPEDEPGGDDEREVAVQRARKPLP